MYTIERDGYLPYSELTKFQDNLNKNTFDDQYIINATFNKVPEGSPVYLKIKIYKDSAFKDFTKTIIIKGTAGKSE